mgnify:CR=1 FL=1
MKIITSAICIALTLSFTAFIVITMVKESRDFKKIKQSWQRAAASTDQSKMLMLEVMLNDFKNADTKNMTVKEKMRRTDRMVEMTHEILGIPGPSYWHDILNDTKNQKQNITATDDLQTIKPFKSIYDY